MRTLETLSRDTGAESGPVSRHHWALAVRVSMAVPADETFHLSLVSVHNSRGFTSLAGMEIQCSP